MPAWRDSEREPRRIGEVMGRAVPGGATFITLLRTWPDVVGENLAAHARPSALHATTLVIAVEDPAWATQLRYLESDLLSRFAEVVGEGRVTELRVVVKPA